MKLLIYWNLDTAVCVWPGFPISPCDLVPVWPRWCFPSSTSVLVRDVLVRLVVRKREQEVLRTRKRCRFHLHNKVSHSLTDFVVSHDVTLLIGRLHSNRPYCSFRAAPLCIACSFSVCHIGINKVNLLISLNWCGCCSLKPVLVTERGESYWTLLTLPVFDRFNPAPFFDATSASWTGFLLRKLPKLFRGDVTGETMPGPDGEETRKEGEFIQQQEQGFTITQSHSAFCRSSGGKKKKKKSTW